MTFRVGQEVVFIGKGIHERGYGYGDEILPVPRQIYIVRALVNHAEKPGLWVEEIVNPQRLYSCVDGIRITEFSFQCCLFRPVVKTSIDIFTAMLTPTSPKQVERV